MGGGAGGQGAGRGGFARGGASGGGTLTGCIEYAPSPSNNNRGVVAFWNDLTCPLTQWSPHSFTDTDVDTGVLETFHTAENFMMAAKARCARDETTRDQILRETDSREVKKLTRGPILRLYACTDRDACVEGGHRKSIKTFWWASAFAEKTGSTYLDASCLHASSHRFALTLRSTS